MKKFLISILFSNMIVGCGVKKVDISKYVTFDNTKVDILEK